MKIIAGDYALLAAGQLSIRRMARLYHISVDDLKQTLYRGRRPKLVEGQPLARRTRALLRASTRPAGRHISRVWPRAQEHHNA